MAVTLGTPSYTSRGTVSLSWSSDLADPTYSIYKNGVLVAATKATSWQFTVSAGESPIIEVRDDDALPVKVWPSRLRLAWQQVDNAQAYRVEQYVDSAWVLKQGITATESPIYHYTTPVLADDTTHQFRVIPIGNNGQHGDPLLFSVLMVRHPDPPQADWAYSENTRKVTIS
jgi:hypothetical protein